ncbi:hypothetical protein BB561_003542 [Smittium simulii]|uniref:Carbohydrate-binding module family 19 domain-containing protein n=1 Tax=Smittium simulii TaxID=133385 RepID=A0A2T9YKU9_9FUNG|nr:hypothetical protein BB561_003542 [Smittium simulii]
MFKSLLKVGFFYAVVAAAVSKISADTNTGATSVIVADIDCEEVPCYNGNFTCLGRNSLSYYQCSNGNYILRSCNPGTVCIPSSPGEIHCGYPSIN